MNEENILQSEEVQNDIFQTEKIEENLLQVNESINNLLEFFQTEKKENLIKEQEEEKILNEDKKVQEEKEQEQKQNEAEFFSNIQTIAANTNMEVNIKLLEDVSNLMQVNIMTSGILIGIVCISLLAKFFKR